MILNIKVLILIKLNNKMNKYNYFYQTYLYFNINKKIIFEKIKNINKNKKYKYFIFFYFFLY